MMKTIFISLFLFIFLGCSEKKINYYSKIEKIWINQIDEVYSINPKICGRLTTAVDTGIKVTLNSDTQTYGPYIAAIDYYAKEWCTIVKDNLEMGIKYSVKAETMTRNNRHLVVYESFKTKNIK